MGEGWLNWGLGSTRKRRGAELEFGFNKREKERDNRIRGQYKVGFGGSVKWDLEAVKSGICGSIKLDLGRV